jgi:hypothetical protein
MGLNVASGVVAGDETWRQAMNRELKMFDEMGIKSFTDAGGHRWKLKEYAEMVARTVPMHVLHVGKMNEFLEYGEDLVEVSTLTPVANSPCPLCAPWEGEILSISGQTAGYSTIADAENAGLFHPRCFHNFALYIPELEESSGSRAAQAMFMQDAEGERLEEDRQKIRDGGFNMNLRRQMQDRHRYGSKEFEQHSHNLETNEIKPSWFLNPDDVEELINTYAGSGKLEYKQGNLYPKETVHANKVIGNAWSKMNNDWVETKDFVIVYSGTGVHAYPIYPLGDD